MNPTKPITSISGSIRGAGVERQCATASLLDRQKESAALFNVSLRGVQWATTVIERGIPEISLAVTRGELTLKSAARLVEALEHDGQRAVMELPPSERQKAIYHLPISHRLAALGEDCR